VNPEPLARGGVLEATSISKSFRSTQVLRNVDFVVHKGETVAVIGPSGSGKSTLCRTLVGLEPFDSGEIRLDGEIFAQRAKGGPIHRGREYSKRRLALGLVFQHFTLFPQLTVIDNVMLAPVKVLGLSKSEARSRAEAVLSRVGLSEKAAAYPGHLSGGQQQRAAIARELAMDRRVLFFDEVTSALDPELVHEVLQVMRDLAESSISMVVVTHEMRFARNAANRVVFMDDGQIVEEGLPADVMDRPQTARARAFIAKVLA
jgi:polar amino acid transport system ATP-binding protein